MIINLILILVYHWICDFVLQTERDATNKWHDHKRLLSHVFDYSVCMSLLVGFILCNVIGALIFFGITFLVHLTQDYFTSKWTHRLSVKARLEGRYHNFFVAIGFDQLLHLIQLFLTYWLLSN